MLLGRGDQPRQQGVVAERRGAGDGEGAGMAQRALAPRGDGVAAGGVDDHADAEAGEFIGARQQPDAGGQPLRLPLRRAHADGDDLDRRPPLRKQFGGAAGDGAPADEAEAQALGPFRGTGHQQGRRVRS